MEVEFCIEVFKLSVAALAFVGAGIALFEWLPDYLRRRKATENERALEWVNNHPIKPKVRRR